MADFAQGLMTGFQFVEGIAARRERQRLANEELGLRRAADARAESAFKTQQEIIADTQLRQQKADRAASIYAHAAEVGVENLTDAQRAEMQELAPYNQNISALLGERREDLDRERVIGELAAMQRQPRTLTDVAGSTQQPTPAVAPPTAPGRITPNQFAYTGMDEELPGSAVAQGTVAQPNPLNSISARSQGEKQMTLAEFKKTYPGIDPATLGDAYSPGIGGVFGNVRLPADFQTADDLSSKTVTEQQQIIDKQAALLGDPTAFSASRAANRQRVASARDTVASWRGAINMEDEAGAEVRRLMAEDPRAAALEFAKDYRTLETLEPNTLAIVKREMTPVVEKAREIQAERMRNVPLDNDGYVVDSPETRAVQREYNQIMAVRQQLSDEYKNEIQGYVRGDAVPVGNKEIAANLAQQVASSPAPAVPPTSGETRANVTMAQRAIQGVQNGRTDKLTTRQIQSLGWAVKHGLISPEGLQTFLATGRFTKPADLQFESHPMDQQLWVNGQLVYTPSEEILKGKFGPKGGKGTSGDLAEDNHKFIHQYFTPPPGSDERQIQRMKDLELGFYMTLDRNSDKLYGGSGINPENYGSMDLADVAYGLNAYTSLVQAQTAFDEDTFMLLPKKWFRGDSKENGLDLTNSDKYKEKYGIPYEPLPVRKPQLDAIRMRLQALDDPRQFWPDDQLARAYMQDVQSAGGPPPPAR